MRWLFVVVVWGLACGGLPFSRPIPLQNDLDGSAALAAAALAAAALEGSFPDDVLAACDEHAPRFVWLAARHDEDQVVAAALKGMAACAQAIDPVDARTVATARLEHESPMVRGGAYAAAGAFVADAAPDDPLVKALLERATHGAPEVRYEALAALDRRAWTPEPEITLQFLRALEAEEPWLVTEMLRRLRFRAAGLDDPTPFRTACLVLTQDKDPGIRGRAALALARLSPEDEEVRALVIAMLDDKHPFARASAAEALADMMYVPAVHDLVTHLDDPRRTTWDMLPFTRVDGTEEVPHHTAGLFERVDDALLRALVRLTEDMGEDRFVYRDVNLRYLALDVVAATRDAVKWYQQHGDKIPER